MTRAERRRARAHYANAPRGDRLHVALRDLSCPFDAVLAAVPAEGRVLEVGCGHGYGSLLIALDRPARHVVGIDIDADKVAVAQRALAGVANLRVEHSTDGAIPPGPWDAIVVIDVLYLLGPERAAALLTEAAGQLAPAGRIVVKEMAGTPRWKRRWTLLQELVSTRVLRITEGDELELVAVDVIDRALSGAGLTVDHERCDRWMPWPHLLITGTRTPSAHRPGHRPRPLGAN